MNLVYILRLGPVPPSTFFWLDFSTEGEKRATCFEAGILMDLSGNSSLDISILPGRLRRNHSIYERCVEVVDSARRLQRVVSGFAWRPFSPSVHANRLTLLDFLDFVIVCRDPVRWDGWKLAPASNLRSRQLGRG